MRVRVQSSLQTTVLATFALTLGVVAGCKGHKPVVPPVSINTQVACEPSIPNQGLALVVHKGAKKLAVVNDGVSVYEFPVVVGPATRGPKRFEGDMRTPEGMYHVIGKHPHPRWRYFIALDYPNDQDVAAYSSALTAGDVELVNGEFPGLGGAIGIHGSDHHEDQANGTNWTRGCVAMSSEDVEVVYAMVRRGTPVLILP